MQPFEARRRDPLITEEAYQVCLATTERMFTDTTYVESRDQIKQVTNDPDAALRVSFYRAEFFIEAAWARYSAGEPLGELRERVKYAFEDLQRHKVAFPEEDFRLWEPTDYYYTMLLTSWSVLFDLPECLDILAGYVNRDPKYGGDRFVSTLFHTLGIPDFPGQAGLLHEDPYGILYASLTESKEDQQKAIKTYLKRWYKSKAFRKSFWYNIHSIKPSVYPGYWAFETGMLTIINDLDDSGYRDMPYYPRDMVDYCREQGWHKKVAERVQAIRGE